MYNYLESMKNDIQEYIKENYSADEIAENMADRDEWAGTLNDILWCCDSVTGNASGSYTFNRYVAKEYVTENEDLLKEALEEFCTDFKTVADKFLNGEWEYFDVTIRCYLLGVAINAALDDMEG